MPNRSERKSLIIILSVFSFVILGTYGVTLIARGYRPSLQADGLTISATGLLSATSRPKGASVYVNNSLVTATDDTLNLSPGDYLVKIVKDGYFPWQKNIKIKKEIVYQTDTELFRSNPDLKPITQSGAINPTVSPNYSKIIYAVASASATTNNGLYLIELSSNILSLNNYTPQQLATNFPGIDWSKATFTFSPNSTEILANFKQNNQNYLIKLNTPVLASNLIDVTPKLSFIQKDWNLQESDIIKTKINRLPIELKTIVATSSASDILFSSTDDKILYLSKIDTKLPDGIISPPPAQSTQLQSRNIEKDNYYVYDTQDDTNYKIGSQKAIIQPQWLQNSNNLIYLSAQSINTINYDSTNQITLFTNNIPTTNFFPYADGNKIIVLTSAYTNATPNLYLITIR